jgi:metal-responsive CopG/Arc/MetJ family transcriptional regulator
MSAMTVELNGEIVEELRRLAAAQERSETEIVREALSTYLRSVRPLPKGMGRYRSGQGTVSEQARDLLRQAVKDNQWP